MIAIIHSFFHEEKGATSVEYALMVGLVALVIIVAVTALGLATNSLFEEAKAEFEDL